MRRSGFTPPDRQTQCQRAAAILHQRIERRGVATVQRELMKVGNR